MKKKLITRHDTPEKKEARIRELVKAGLSREDAELLDVKVYETTDAIMETFEERIMALTETRSELGPVMYIQLVKALGAIMHEAWHEAERAHLASMGIHIMEMSPDNVGDVHDFLASSLGEDGSDGSVH